MNFHSNLSKQVIFGLNLANSYMYNLRPCYSWNETPVKILVWRKELIAKCLKQSQDRCKSVNFYNKLE